MKYIVYIFIYLSIYYYCYFETTEESIGLVIFCKKKTGGCCICVTSQAIVVGTYDSQSSSSAGYCNGTVQSLASYMLKNGF